MFAWSFQTVRGGLLGVATALVPLLLVACSRSEVNVNLFEDVTTKSGLDAYTGMTYGAAWGDFDADGLPDLYVTNHLSPVGAKLFHNLGNGRFNDVTDKFFSAQDLGGDKHGAVWGDFNNDGREDLVQMTGGKAGVGSEAKRLFLNTDANAKFMDVAENLGVSNPWGRARMPLWYDFNNDGLLDLFEGAAQRYDDRTPPFVFIQKQGKFVESDALKFVERTAPFCIVTALAANHPNLVCRVAGHGEAARVFDMAALPARELAALLPHTAFEDIATADFDNDGQIDLFMTRKNPAGTVAFGRPSNNEVIADIRIDQTNVDKPAGFTYRSSGPVTFTIFPTWPSGALPLDQIHYGKQGTHPDSYTFTLSPDTPGVEGIAPNQPGKQSGVYIGLKRPHTWEVRVTGLGEDLTGKGSKYQEVQVKITSTGPMQNLEAIGDPPKQEEAPARLFMNRNGKLVEEGDKRGVNARLVAGMNVVAGDFNNDMHSDLFVVVSNEIGKQENLLLLNRGDGTFDVVSNAGGAAGGLAGIGDTVTAVDYDRDGSLDLLITTGGSMGRSEGLPSDYGSYHLYHNVSKGNHWIEMDLEGTKSNRNGVGAIVRLTAGGVTQTRVQDGGVHRRSQNFQRLHFGLARNTQIDNITVQWPSGVAQELLGVKADQILRVKEPGT